MVSSSLIEKYTMSRACGHVFCEDAKKTKHCWGLMKAVSPQRMMYHWGNRSPTSSTGHTLSSHRQKYGQRSALRETDREFPTMTDESKIPTLH